MGHGPGDRSLQCHFVCTASHVHSSPMGILGNLSGVAYCGHTGTLSGVAYCGHTGTLNGVAYCGHTGTLNVRSDQTTASVPTDMHSQKMRGGGYLLIMVT
jgi:hypothetical protein